MDVTSQVVSGRFIWQTRGGVASESVLVTSSLFLFTGGLHRVVAQGHRRRGHWVGGRPAALSLLYHLA
jgi:hypothetical protein